MRGDEILWIWLTTIPGVGRKTRRILLNHFGNPEKIYQASLEELQMIAGINKKQAASIYNERKLEKAKMIIKLCGKYNIDILKMEDEAYPKRALIDPETPVLIYKKGDFQLEGKSVGIVGPRRCTQEDKFKTAEITRDYVKNDYTIISGMAKGVDSYAHTACLNSGGKTIAVLGNGIDICYPSEHLELKRVIEERGLIISEYPPGTSPTQYNFPERNRIIAAWSDELVVVSPGKNSGSLITKEFAEGLGRKVFVR